MSKKDKPSTAVHRVMLFDDSELNNRINEFLNRRLAVVPVKNED